MKGAAAAPAASQKRGGWRALPVLVLVLLSMLVPLLFLLDHSGYLEDDRGRRAWFERYDLDERDFEHQAVMRMKNQNMWRISSNSLNEFSGRQGQNDSRAYAGVGTGSTQCAGYRAHLVSLLKGIEEQLLKRVDDVGQTIRQIESEDQSLQLQ